MAALQPAHGSSAAFSERRIGAVIVEYSLIVAGVSVAIIAAVFSAGGGIKSTFTTLSNYLASASK